MGKGGGGNGGGGGGALRAEFGEKSVEEWYGVLSNESFFGITVRAGLWFVSITVLVSF